MIDRQYKKIYIDNIYEINSQKNINKNKIKKINLNILYITLFKTYYIIIF